MMNHITDARPIRVELIRIDGGTQPRVSISEDVVADYADAMTNNSTLPPVDVFFDGAEYWLADGFHRYHAAKVIGLTEIPSTLHAGTCRDAVLFSVGVNRGHGLQRTKADKRKAAMTLLRDDEWAGWSDREIARRCGVDHTFIGDLRRSLVVTTSENSPRTYTTKHGTEATMNVEKIGRRPNQKQQAAAKFEARKAMAVEGASASSLRRLPRKDACEVVANTVNALHGVIGALAQIDAQAVASDPRAPEWRFAIDDAIGSLRAFNRQLPQGQKRVTA